MGSGKPSPMAESSRRARHYLKKLSSKILAGSPVGWGQQHSFSPALCHVQMGSSIQTRDQERRCNMYALSDLMGSVTSLTHILSEIKSLGK